jgi:6-phosphogluconolactonase
MIRTFFRAILLGVFFFVSLTARLYAQGNFIYVNNGGEFNTHSVSGYAVAANGALSEIAGSPFLTGGSGIGIGITKDNMVIAAVGNFLYVPNGNSATITVFSINPQTGSLTPVPGSPFSLGIQLALITLAVTSDNHFLYAAQAGHGDIAAFSIAANGALTPVPGSPFRTSDTRIAVSPDGKFLFAVLLGTNLVDVYRIGADGALTPVPGSRVRLGDEDSGEPYALEVNCASDRLFVGEQTFGATRIHVLNIAADGTLTPVPGSVFQFTGGSDSKEIALRPGEQHLFVSNINNARITALNVAASGSLSAVPGSPFFVGSAADEDLRPVDLTTDQAGSFLYVPNANGTTGVFNIAADGVLSQIAGSPFPARHGYGASVVAYPPKHCGGPSFDTCLQDDSNANLLQINSTTGEYQFSNCAGVTVTGTGSIRRKGGRVTLHHNISDRRLLAKLETNAHRATASVQLLTSGTTFTISDRNTADNSCACSR